MTLYRVWDLNRQKYWAYGQSVYPTSKGAKQSVNTTRWRHEIPTDYQIHKFALGEAGRTIVDSVIIKWS